MQTMMKGLAVLLVLAFVHLAVIPVGHAQGAEDATSGSAKGAGLQAASWLLTIPYGATKVCFAILGGVTGGLTYVFSGGNLDAAKSVWHTSVYGTYVITPEHLQGDKPVRFLGVASDNDGAPLTTEPGK
ncbi:MAG: hypothetical protein KGL03_11885 [Nitrospirota bacterium]|nr:hypothetical protein [Nitrospirota bacterium]MDE3119701.1 hypothetical protein [Nitrospirota bacterium]